MACYLVTGAAGFIGSHLCQGLVAAGHRVRGLDDLSGGSWSNLGPSRGAVECREGSVASLADLRAAAAGVDAIFHEAALPSVTRSVTDPHATHAVCATGTLNVLLAARDCGVRRVVYAGSSSAYGDSLELPKHEGMVPAPLSPYAAAKLAGEMYAAAAASCYGVEAVVLRYFNVYGPRQDPASPYSAVIPLFTTALLRGQSPTIYGDGLQTRDFTYVADVVAANLLALNPAVPSGGVFNVATGQRASLLDLIAALQRLIGTAVAPVFAAARVGDVRDSVADISRARRVLGFEPRYDLATGLAECVRHYREVLGR